MEERSSTDAQLNHKTAAKRNAWGFAWALPNRSACRHRHVETLRKLDGNFRN